MALIPIMTSAIQEQQKIIDILKLKTGYLEKEIIMKNFRQIATGILTLLFCVSISPFIYSQSWGEMGTKWVYKRVTQGQLTLVEYEVISDTIVDNTSAKVISYSILDYYGIDTMTFYSKTTISNIVCSSIGDSVFWYNDGEYQFLYDFSPVIGTEWTTHENTNYTCINTLPNQDIQKVLNLSNMIIDGHDIDVIELMEGANWTMGDKIYKNIGSSNSFLPQPGNNCAGIDTGPSLGVTLYLTCFYSPTIGYIQFNIPFNPIIGYTGCEDLVSVKQISFNNESSINLYPNPATTNQLYIENPKNKIIDQVKFYDTTGRLQKVYSQPSDKIDVSISEFSNGIYFVVFIGNEKSILHTQKIIINNK